ncbi:MAG: hypothetical protein QM523_03295 [Candidatus Pacebacteria bacterium]|nr:hypothetical protein [Candidatus Paceibacterota bacterium]
MNSIWLGYGFAAPIGPRRRFLALWWGCFLLIVGGLAFAIFSVQTLPLVDYPNHLARMVIIADGGKSPMLAHYYGLEWRALPNLAMDLIVPPLGLLIGVELAMKVFVLTALILLGGGTIILHRYLWQRDSLWSLLGFEFILGRSLLWGFLNFLFAAGLAMVVFALWLQWRESRPRLALVILAVGAIGVYFSHFVAFGILASLIGVVYIMDCWRLRHWSWIGFLAIAGAFILPLSLFILTYFLNPNQSASAVSAIEFGNYFRKFDLPFALFKSYNLWLDSVTAIVLVGFLAFGLMRNRLQLSAMMVAPLVLMIVLYFLMPESILTATLVDQRLPLFIALVVAAGSLPNLVEARYAAVCLVGFALLFGLRLTILTSVWHGQDEQLQEARQLLSSLPVGAKIVAQIDDSDLGIRTDHPPFDHLVTLAVIERQALVPRLFVNPSQQPLRYRQAAPSYRQATPKINSADYVLVLSTSPWSLPQTNRPSQRIGYAMGGILSLYRLK